MEFNGAIDRVRGEAVCTVYIMKCSNELFICSNEFFICLNDAFKSSLNYLNKF